MWPETLVLFRRLPTRMAFPMLKILPGPRMFFASYALLRVGSHYCRVHSHAKNHQSLPNRSRDSNTVVYDVSGPTAFSRHDGESSYCLDSRLSHGVIKGQGGDTFC